jgi:hypothetical protein
LPLESGVRTPRPGPTWQPWAMGIASHITEAGTAISLSSLRVQAWPMIFCRFSGTRLVEVPCFSVDTQEPLTHSEIDFMPLSKTLLHFRCSLSGKQSLRLVLFFIFDMEDWSQSAKANADWKEALPSENLRAINTKPSLCKA